MTTTAARIDFEAVTMADLRPGDIVIEYGMRCRVESIVALPVHPLRSARADGNVYAATTTILNPDYVREHRSLFGGIVRPDEPHTVQGIARRQVTRETTIPDFASR